MYLSKKAFKTGDRADLIHTSFQLAYQGSTSYSNVDDLTEYLTFREKDYVPWRIFIYHINLILGLMEHRPGFEKLSVKLTKKLIFPFWFYELIFLKGLCY